MAPVCLHARTTWGLPGSLAVNRAENASHRSPDDTKPIDWALPEGAVIRAVTSPRWGVTVDVSQMRQGRAVVINYLWYRGSRVWADGVPVDCQPDEFGRIRVETPPGAETLTVGYHSPWLSAGGIGAVLVLLGVVGHTALNRFIAPSAV